MSETEKYELLISLMHENKEDFKALRASSHEIRDELHRVSGQIQLQRQELATQKNDSKEKLERVHSRIDKEQEDNKENFQIVKKDIKDIEQVVNDIAPKINRISTITDWAARIIVTTMIGAIFYAISLYITVK